MCVYKFKKLRLTSGNPDNIIKKFVNLLMIDGKKPLAFKIYSNMMRRIKLHKRQKGETPHLFFFKAVELSRTCVSYKEVYKGKRKDLIPVIMDKGTSYLWAIKRIIKFAKLRRASRQSLSDALYLEIVDLNNKKGEAYAEKIKFHNDVFVNKDRVWRYKRYAKRKNK